VFSYDEIIDENQFYFISQCAKTRLQRCRISKNFPEVTHQIPVRGRRRVEGVGWREGKGRRMGIAYPPLSA